MWEQLACDVLCKWLSRSLWGFKVGKARWLSRQRESKVSLLGLSSSVYCFLACAAPSPPCNGGTLQAQFQAKSCDMLVCHCRAHLAV